MESRRTREVGIGNPLGAQVITFSPTLLDEVRRSFWYVSADSGGESRIFFDSAAGSLVLRRAHDALVASSRISSYAGAHYPDSARVDRLVEEARRAVAGILNASPRGIISAESTTVMQRRLARAILASLAPKSRVLVSAADHNANIDPWRLTAAELRQQELDVQMVRFDPRSGVVDLEHLETLLTGPRPTGLFAVSHASNALGSENPIPEIRDLLARYAPQAFLIVDGVHFLPHGPADVHSMKADAYTFSAYKLFAQRGLSFAWGSERLLRLPHYRLAPSPEEPPESWELGFRNPADFAPVIEVARYLAWLGERAAEEDAGTAGQAGPPEDRGEAARRGCAALRRYEAGLVRAMFDGVGSVAGLRHIDGITLYGAREPSFYPRKEPTFCFRVRGLQSQAVERTLWDEYRIAVRSGDHYATETHRQLGVPDTVRASLAHYNTVDEVEAFLDALARIAKR